MYVQLEALLEYFGGPEFHAAALLLLPLLLPLLCCLRVEEQCHEGVAIVDDVDGDGQDVEDEVEEVDVDAGLVGPLVLAEVHVYVMIVRRKVL